MNEVPCNGCTLCCKGDAVRILPHEDASRWLTEPHPYFPGSRMLAHKPNDECFYLTQNGCSIHDSKPQVCGEMDCREIYKAIPFKAAQRLHLQGSLKLAVWRRGQELKHERTRDAAA